MRMVESEGRRLTWGGKRPRKCFLPQRCQESESLEEIKAEEEEEEEEEEDSGEEEEPAAAAAAAAREGGEVSADEGDEKEEAATAPAQEEAALAPAEEEEEAAPAEEASKEPVSHFRSLSLSLSRVSNVLYYRPQEIGLIDFDALNIFSQNDGVSITYCVCGHCCNMYSFTAE